MCDVRCGGSARRARRTALGRGLDRVLVPGIAGVVIVVMVVVVVIVVMAGDGPGIGGIDRGGGLRPGSVDGRWRVVLEVRQGRMVGMRHQPAVDECLDDPRPAERAPDEALAAIRLEVADRLGILLACLP